ncbi:IS91 family transposase [Vibrio minamisatsumaniensis]|uniref:IS91 family transposase n=1 Tax=Vibrio minamisatsumaniensis TaxID=2910243 RepID=UPI003D1BCED6
MHPNKPIKQLFNANDNWLNYLNKHRKTLRTVVIENVTKMLACSTAAFGSKEYRCCQANCTHHKFIHQTCKSRFCSSCGIKATERWIRKQQHVFPECEYQHVTLTLPHTLWPIFRYNRFLLNRLFGCAAKIFLGWAKQLGIDIGVFCALHTYGRKLNWNVHIHLSVTRGGLCKKTGLWKPIFFKAKTTEKCWRAAITQLLDSNYSQLNLTGERCPFVRHEQDWSRFLISQYCRRWKLHFAKKTANVTPTMTYLGRYLKRPPISASRLRHNFQGGLVTFDYLNHRNGRTESLILSPEALIERMIEHIPDKHFKMIRYFGFLSNRRRSEMLPKVYDALGIAPEDSPEMPGYAAMLKGYVKVDPFECILCGNHMTFLRFRAGEPLSELVHHALVQSQIRSI